MYRKISLIGAAIDACGNKAGAATTPDNISNTIKPLGLSFDNIFRYNGGRAAIDELSTFFTQIAFKTETTLLNHGLPIVVGGDHSCAIGTWSGIANGLEQRNKSLGIIWIDAHMDAHTPETSPSGNIHGMPVATILGYGYDKFINILNDKPKVKPENIILIGVRSFEDGEANLLKKLGVQVYYNHDIAVAGFNNIFSRSIEKLNRQVDSIGLSIDLDGFDPKFTPGVSTAVLDGIDFNEFIISLNKASLDKLVGVEITEGNILFDRNGITMQCVVEIIAKIASFKIAN